jgi:NAD+ dependent glucose-6-phosphate dehydrogenase
MKPRILVTGSEGLIGGILCQGLAANYEVFGLDVKVSDKPRHHTVDIFNLDDLTSTLRALKPTYLLHFAASVCALDDWNDNLRSNIIGTRNIYVAAARTGVKRVVYASSNQVVKGHEAECPDGFAIPIGAEPCPTTYYACSKLFGEALARRHYERDGLESICLRIGTVTGAELSLPEGRMSRTWLSHRDLLRIVEQSLRAEVGFGIYYAVSGNSGRLHDLESARRELSYVPIDNGATIGRWARRINRFRNKLRGKIPVMFR